MTGGGGGRGRNRLVYLDYFLSYFFYSMDFFTGKVNFYIYVIRIVLCRSLRMASYDDLDQLRTMRADDLAETEK